MAPGGRSIIVISVRSVFMICCGSRTWCTCRSTLRNGHAPSRLGSRCRTGAAPGIAARGRFRWARAGSLEHGWREWLAHACSAAGILTGRRRPRVHRLASPYVVRTGAACTLSVPRAATLWIATPLHLSAAVHGALYLIIARRNASAATPTRAMRFAAAVRTPLGFRASLSTPLPS